MAADSRVSNGDHEFLTHAEKITRLPTGALYGGAGDGDDRELLTLLQRATASRLPSRRALAATQVDVAALLAFPSGPVFYLAVYKEEEDWKGELTRVLAPFCAVGSGRNYAMGAMEHGASAAEAVEIACRHDAMSGLPLQCIRLEPSRRKRGMK